MQAHLAPPNEPPEEREDDPAAFECGAETPQILHNVFFMETHSSHTHRQQPCAWARPHPHFRTERLLYLPHQHDQRWVNLPAMGGLDPWCARSS